MVTVVVLDCNGYCGSVRPHLQAPIVCFLTDSGACGSVDTGSHFQVPVPVLDKAFIKRQNLSKRDYSEHKHAGAPTPTHEFTDCIYKTEFTHNLNGQQTETRGGGIQQRGTENMAGLLFWK